MLILSNTYWLQIQDVSKILLLVVYLYKHVKHFHHYEADYKLRVTLWSEMHNNLMISIFACGSHTPAEYMEFISNT